MSDLKNLTEPSKLVAHVIALLGGPDKAWSAFDSEFKIATDRWNRNVDAIGRILRSHLFVEHFLSEYLQHRNPDLGLIANARLSFAQKVYLLNEGDRAVAYLIPGIRRLNSIRNRLAHTMDAGVTSADVVDFLQTKLFVAMRAELARGNGEPPRSDPIDILEEFAKHAGLALQAGVSTLGSVWAEALRRAEADRK